MSKGRENKHEDFHVVRCSVIPAYVHSSKQPKLDDFTIQAFQGFKSLQLTFKVSMNLYNKEIISQSLQLSVYHTYTLTNL